MFLGFEYYSIEFSHDAQSQRYQTDCKQVDHRENEDRKQVLICGSRRHLRREENCDPHDYERGDASNSQTYRKPVDEHFSVDSDVWAEIQHVGFRFLFFFLL